MLLANGLKFTKEQIYSDCDSVIINAFYYGNVSLIESFMEDDIVKEFMNEVRHKNPLLYACFMNDMRTIEEILSTDTNLMNEAFFTVILYKHKNLCTNTYLYF